MAKPRRPRGPRSTWEPKAPETKAPDLQSPEFEALPDYEADPVAETFEPTGEAALAAVDTMSAETVPVETISAGAAPVPEAASSAEPTPVDAGAPASSEPPAAEPVLAAAPVEDAPAGDALTGDAPTGDDPVARAPVEGPALEGPGTEDPGTEGPAVEAEAAVIQAVETGEIPGREAAPPTGPVEAVAAASPADAEPAPAEPAHAGPVVEAPVSEAPFVEEAGPVAADLDETHAVAGFAVLSAAVASDETGPAAPFAPVQRATGFRFTFAPERFDIVDIGVTIAGYMRGEGEAAAAHMRALGGARSPADMIRLQVGEAQRAADASLTCWTTVARKAGRVFALR